MDRKKLIDEGPFGVFKHFKIDGEQGILSAICVFHFWCSITYFAGVTIGASLERFMPNSMILKLNLNYWWK